MTVALEPDAMQTDGLMNLIGALIRRAANEARGGSQKATQWFHSESFENVCLQCGCDPRVIRCEMLSAIESGEVVRLSRFDPKHNQKPLWAHDLTWEERAGVPR